MIAKALSDESRVRALLSLQGGELCLCQIIDVLGLSPATVSKHMNLLRGAGLVERRKDGRWHFYRLAGGEEDPVAARALAWARDALRGDPLVRDDARRVKAARRKDLEELSSCYRS